MPYQPYLPRKKNINKKVLPKRYIHPFVLEKDKCELNSKFEHKNIILTAYANWKYITEIN